MGVAENDRHVHVHDEDVRLGLVEDDFDDLSGDGALFAL